MKAAFILGPALVQMFISAIKLPFEETSGTLVVFYYAILLIYFFLRYAAENAGRTIFENADTGPVVEFGYTNVSGDYWHHVVRITKIYLHRPKSDKRLLLYFVGITQNGDELELTFRADRATNVRTINDDKLIDDFEVFLRSFDQRSNSSIASVEKPTKRIEPTIDI